MPISRSPLFPLALGLLLPGCFDNITTEFPDELAPLEENTAPAPEPDGDDLYPEVLAMEDGPTTDYHWVHARGYLKASVEDVYAAMRLPEVTVDADQVDEWSVSFADDEIDECLELPEVIEHCHRIENLVDDLITVRFHVVWRFGTMAADDDGAPMEVLGRWQKTWGSEVIELLEGSVIVRPVEGADEPVTEIELIEHLDAFRGSRDNAISFVKDYYAGIREMLHPENP